jgi:hypothetical protein
MSACRVVIGRGHLSHDRGVQWPARLPSGGASRSLANQKNLSGLQATVASADGFQAISIGRDKTIQPTTTEHLPIVRR